MYYCMNVVTEEEGHASAVLLRAVVEPIQDITDRTQGPGLLCKAMQITKKQTGHDLLSDDDLLLQNRVSRSQNLPL